MLSFQSTKPVSTKGYAPSRFANTSKGLVLSGSCNVSLQSLNASLIDLLSAASSFMNVFAISRRIPDLWEFKILRTTPRKLHQWYWDAPGRRPRLIFVYVFVRRESEQNSSLQLAKLSQVPTAGQGTEIATEPTGHRLPLSKCEAYDRVYDQRSRSS